ncbi:MAG: transcription elongation factor GreB [Betaproteobacteria bacterium]|jgi:transcription elongation factor GreB|nr:transcription elongation factor GreB [Betaproteobacteria bacterium]
MSKAFTRENDEAEEEEPAEPSEPAVSRYYMTPAGYDRLRAELKSLVEVERPEVVRTVSWAASNGDRSENGDYIYGKRRLREIDRRVRFLIRRLENSEVVRSAGRESDQVFFGATVTVRSAEGGERSVTIVGLDEVDLARGRVSWVSPIAKALIKAREGDFVALRTPGGNEELEILNVKYVDLD